MKVQNKASHGVSGSPGRSHLSPTPPPGTCPTLDGQDLTHRRGTLEFGSAVGEVVGGRLTAHWFQLQREKGNLIPPELGRPPC